MSAEEQKHKGKRRPHVIILWRHGWPPGELMELLFRLELGEGPLSGGPGDSPIGCRTSSIFADSKNGWTKGVSTECYTSEAKVPLYLLQFRGGFWGGDYIVLTNMSWSVKVNSVSDSCDHSSFRISSPPPGDLEDECPTNEAMMCAQSGATFKPEPEDPGSNLDTRRFLHQGKDDGNLQDVVLTVGPSFSAKLIAKYPVRCVVIIGFPEKDPALLKPIADLLETESRETPD